MWSLLPRHLQLLVIVGASILFARSYEACSSFWTGRPAGTWSTISATATAIGTALTVAANFTWRWFWRRLPLLQETAFPDFNGVWTGKLTSTWVNPDTGQRPPPIDMAVTIRQGLFRTNISLKTGESSSHSTRAILERFADTGRARIWYTYDNEPKAQVRDRSAKHEGVAFLEAEFGDLDHLTGRYFTDRRTTGDMDLQREKSKP